MDIVTYALCKKMASGSKGEKGDPGEKGEQGLPGRDGADGVTPNLQVGDVVTLEAGQQASITRRGNDENPIFDFAIPKGDTGKDGIFVGRVEDAPDHAQVVVNDDASPYDLFFEDANVSYMGDTYTSLKEKSDADIEYLLREIQTQHYEGQRITATNTYQKQVKSAILKGQTLVNLIKDNTGDGVLLTEGHKDLKLLYTLKNSTQYTLLMNVVSADDNNTPNWWCGIMKTGNWGSESKRYVKGINKLLFTTQEESNCYAVRIRGLGTTIKDIMLLEGDYTNIDIPYFEGMQSVKMPVLTTTTSQNLSSVPFSFFEKTTDRKYGAWTIFEFDNLFSGKIIINKRPFNTIMYFDTKENRPNIGTTVVKDVQFIAFYNPSTNIENNNKGNLLELLKSGELDISLQENGKTNVYSYKKNDKTNILTVNEPVELRGIGEVRDTLDCLTGEVTERIGEIMLDGSEGVWSKHSGLSTDEYDVYWTSNGFIPSVGKKMLSDKLGYSNPTTPNTFRINDSGGIFIGVSKGVNINDYLSQNTPKIQYDLSQSIIKTVDLNNQKVYSYDGTTHYTTSSGVEGHPAPILSIDVPTNLPALVSRQRDTIKDLEKENEALKEEVAVVDQQRESGDLELLSSDFDLDFRLMEIEFALDIPIAATFKEVRNMARTPYEMAKILILGGKYERSDIEYKLGKYLERKQITQAQYDELIALMEANELVV